MKKIIPLICMTFMFGCVSTTTPIVTTEKKISKPRAFLIDDLKYYTQCYLLSDIQELNIALKNKDTNLYNTTIRRCFTVFDGRSVLEDIQYKNTSLCKYRVHSIFNTKKLASYSLGKCKTDTELKEIQKNIRIKIKDLGLNKK